MGFVVFLWHAICVWATNVWAAEYYSVSEFQRLERSVSLYVLHVLIQVKGLNPNSSEGEMAREK